MNNMIESTNDAQKAPVGESIIEAELLAQIKDELEDDFEDCGQIEPLSSWEDNERDSLNDKDLQDHEPMFYEALDGYNKPVIIKDSDNQLKATRPELFNRNYVNQQDNLFFSISKMNSFLTKTIKQNDAFSILMINPNHDYLKDNLWENLDFQKHIELINKCMYKVSNDFVVTKLSSWPSNHGTTINVQGYFGLLLFTKEQSSILCKDIINILSKIGLDISINKEDLQGLFDERLKQLGEVEFKLSIAPQVIEFWSNFHYESIEQCERFKIRLLPPNSNSVPFGYNAYLTLRQDNDKPVFLNIPLNILDFI